MLLSDASLCAFLQCVSALFYVSTDTLNEMRYDKIRFIVRLSLDTGAPVSDADIQATAGERVDAGSAARSGSSMRR